MFLLQLLPTSMLIYFVNLIFYTGIACTLFGFIFRFKFFEQWRLIIQVVGILALGAGLYMKGGYEFEMQWRDRVAEMQKKVDAAEAKSKVVNTDIKTKIVTKIKKIKEVQYKTKEVIKEHETVINAECKVPKEAIDILNSSARGEAAVVTKGLTQ